MKSTRLVALITLVAVVAISTQLLASPFLGVALNREDGETKGARVVQVMPGSPADKSGFKSDDVIVGVNDTEIADAISLIESIGKLNSGDKVKVKFDRDGESKSVDVTLGEKPVSQTPRSLPNAFPIDRPVIGVALQLLDDGKLVVASVIPNTGAAAAEIQAGDVIVEFDGTKIDGYKQLANLVGKHKVGDEVSMKLKRDGETLEKTLKLKAFGIKE